ncbi:MAG TPA: MlaD family protein [Gemmatimonadaceae bacterium]|jgi:ABC-type transporter Mla subunit MlaD|nr:MlaD family protein [Gemmatimonadaceae bacterium]
MARQLYWRELTGGIIAAAAIAAVTLAVLMFARVGGVHGKKVTLYVVTAEAPGILAGTEVWVAGQKEGVVKDVTFQPPTAPESERVVITTEFLKEALPSVRRDSYAQIKPGGSMIGTLVVAISPGTATALPLGDGDTVYARHRAAVANLTEDIDSVGPQFAALGAATKQLADNINRPVGTIGNYRASGLADLSDVSAGMSSLSARATTGNGTIVRVMQGDIRSRASHAMAAADSIRTLMASNRGSFGRFRADTTLITNATHILAELDTLQTLMSDPVGSIAAAHSDSTLTLQLARTHTLLASLIKDAKSHPLRYIRF